MILLFISNAFDLFLKGFPEASEYAECSIRHLSSVQFRVVGTSDMYCLLLSVFTL